MKKFITSSFSILLVFIVYGCTSSVNDASNIPDESSINTTSLQKNMPVVELTPQEKNGLIHMREEEKLARDVYTAMYKKWNLIVFQNISKSEQTHMDALLTLLKRYAITDPVGNNGVGKFTDVSLQTLYNTLIAKGNLTILDALNVGKAIEELDIKDLKEQISLLTNKTDVLRVYTNLKLGSDNHLQAFTSNIKKYTN